MWGAGQPSTSDIFARMGPSGLVGTSSSVLSSYVICKGELEVTAVHFSLECTDFDTVLYYSPIHNFVCCLKPIIEFGFNNLLLLLLLLLPTLFTDQSQIIMT